MKKERNNIIFTKTEVVDGCVSNINIYESDVKEHFSKDYFNMSTEEKEIVEKYFCGSIAL